MSKTDKTRPWRINETDPSNQRFRRVVAWELGWFYKAHGTGEGLLVLQPEASLCPGTKEHESELEQAAS